QGRLGQLEGRAGRLFGEDVLPDRVARTRVEELDAFDRGERSQTGEERPRLFGQDLRRPRRCRGGLVVEVADGELAEHDQVVVADEAEVRAGGDGLAAFVRARP